jgi:DNA polymerase III delta prime subunit
MFESVLKEKYMFATRFFESALSGDSKKLAHAFLLTGSDAAAQYMLALSLAKVLNCQNPDKAEFCGCTNCMWLAQNRHPAVITISPVDFIHPNSKGEAKTVITVDQTRFLRNELMISSQYHRVIIFTGAKEGEEYAREAERIYQNFKIPYPKNSFDDSERIWIPTPLNQQIFSDEAPNTLLKTIEEPGDNITFFFLARDRDDVMDTIVSRCQHICVNSNEIKSVKTDALSEFLQGWPPKNELEAVHMAEFIAEKSQKEDYKPQELLEILQEHFKNLINLNINDKNIVLKLTQAVKKSEIAKQQIQSYVNLNSALETMFLSMI